MGGFSNMSILDELKKWTHPYDEDEDYDDEDELEEAPPAGNPALSGSRAAARTATTRW